MDHKVWVIPFVGKEGRHTSSLAWSVIVGEFCQREKHGPVILLVVAVSAEVLLEGLVDPFSLSVSLGVVPRGEVELHIECSTKTAEEVGDEF